MCSIFAALTRMMTQVPSSAGSILFCLEHAGPDPIPIPILGLDPDSNPNPASRVSQEALKGIILQDLGGLQTIFLDRWEVLIIFYFRLRFYTDFWKTANLHADSFSLYLSNEQYRPATISGAYPFKKANKLIAYHNRSAVVSFRKRNWT